MQKVFILVLFLSLLHRPSAQNITVSPITAANSDACTTGVVVSTNEVAIDFDPRTLYQIDMCLFYNHPEGQPLTSVTPCPGEARVLTYEFDVLSGESGVAKTYTVSTGIYFFFRESTVSCVPVRMSWLQREYANQDFNNLRVKARITLIANLNGGSVVATINGGKTKVKAVGTYPAFDVPMYSVHTVLCYDVPHCTLTATKTGEFDELDPVHYGVVSNHAPVRKWGSDAYVDANTFLAKVYRCYSSNGCTVAVTVADGTPKVASGGPQNTD